jgi:hypothetical protein
MMRSDHIYSAFAKVCMVLSIPLVAAIFWFSDDPKLNWVSKACTMAIVLIGLVGASRAFVKFVIKGEPQKSVEQTAAEAGLSLRFIMVLAALAMLIIAIIFKVRGWI